MPGPRYVLTTGTCTTRPATALSGKVPRDRVTFPSYITPAENRPMFLQLSHIQQLRRAARAADERSFAALDSPTGGCR